MPSDLLAVETFQICLNNLNAGLPYPGRREDFDSTEAFNTWRQAEVTHLSQLVMIMVQFNPELAKENTSSSPSPPTSSLPSERPPTLYTDRPESIYNQFARMKSSVGEGSIKSSELEAMLEHVGEDESGSNLTFIPGNVRSVYKRLLELCVDFDLVRVFLLLLFLFFFPFKEPKLMDCHVSRC